MLGPGLENNIITLESYASVHESYNSKFIDSFAVEMYMNLSKNLDKGGQKGDMKEDNKDNNNTKIDNILFSPWSISEIFSTLYEGAESNTAEELSDVFNLPRDSKKSISTNEDKKNLHYLLHTANALWINEGYDIESSFIKKSQEKYNTSIQNIDFRSHQSARTINQWVSDNTDGKIKEIFKNDQLGKETVMALTNAIYFKGSWLIQFDKSNTSTEKFILQDGNSINVQMMKADNVKFNYTENQDLQILELPYKGDNISMIVLLPRENIKIVENSLSADTLRGYIDDMYLHKVNVEIPKFQLSQNYDLIKLLKEMGVSTVFDPNRADFTNISKDNLYIDTAQHKSFVDVNEQGTEAAAATEIEAIPLSLSPQINFKADHSFIFIIMEKINNEILFMGRLAHPIEQ